MIPAKEFEGELWIKASDYHQAIKTAQRPWVGLTPEELNMIGDSMRTWNIRWSITDVYTAIEAKLKERNA